MENNVKEIESYVVDTSVVIEKVVSKLIKEKKIAGRIIVPHVVVAELENQANNGLEIGFLGLEELQEIRELAKSINIQIEFIGRRPTEAQVRFAKSGELDALIREIAYNEDATLITADTVQRESAKVFGVKVMFIEAKKPKEKIELEKFFDETTMSIHLKEKCNAYAKKGHPGEWSLVKISDEKLSSEKLQEMAKEIVEKSRIDPGSFVEIARRGSTIVQYKNYRIVITRPPVSDGWEITAVKPLKKLSLDYYKLSSELFDRIKEKSRGIIIAGQPGAGKSTFAQALAEFYLKSGNVVKTVESPRDLQLPDEITQYSKNFTSSEEIHDILFLSRPDNIIFDEMRDTPDFTLYTDLRLAGSECIGVLHSSSPIDTVQRFISRLETGMIPSVLDTILFIEKGKISKVYGLKMIVKVPTGMTEADLSRPVVELRDLTNDKLEYEIYSYGEETVVIPVEAQTTEIKGAKELATRAIKNALRKYSDKMEVEILNNNRAIVSVPEKVIPRLIGTKGKNIEEIEKELGISLDVRELKKDKQNINFDFREDKDCLRFFVEPGCEIDLCIDNKYIFTAFSSKRGEIKIHKKSKLGRDILEALNKKKKLELKA